MRKTLPSNKMSANSMRPKGFSLLEVLLAMGILFGSLAVLSQLASLGIEHLNRAETSLKAVRLCQNKLGEVLAGIQPLENIEDQPLIEDLQWNYSIEVQSLDPLPLSEVHVRVSRISEVERKSKGRRGRFELVRWIYHEGEERVDRKTRSKPSRAPFSPSSASELSTT